jgi:DNA polymerase III sliding clamp (beta) subunit (PCNA family)
MGGFYMDKLLLARAAHQAASALKSQGPGGDSLVITAKNGQVEITGASRTMCVWASVPADCSDMQCAVSARMFTAILERFKGVQCADIKLSLQKEGLVITGGQARIVLPVLDKVDTTHDIRDTDYDVQIPLKGLGESVKQIVHALETTYANPVLNAICLQVFNDGGFRVIASDGKRIAFRRTANKDAVCTAEFVVYGKALENALTMLEEEDCVTIFKPKNGSFIRMSGENLEISISLLSQKYFNFSSLEDTIRPLEVEVSREEMEYALTLTKIMSQQVFLDISETGIRVFTRETEGETEITVPVLSHKELAGRVIKTKFNADFLLTALRTLPDEKIYIKMQHGMSAMFFGSNEANEIICPLRRGFD